ncbi:MAG TPA: hypothetical protein VGG75_38080 [Trebonia sp.]
MTSTEVPFPAHVTFEMTLVTPKDAERYLKTMHANRSQSKLDTAVMELNLREGTFFPGISPVYLDDADRAWDGQHRFAAIIRTGIATYLPFIRGITTEEAEYIDTGRKRTYADTLRMLAIPDYKRASVLAKYMALYENYGIDGVRNPGKQALTRASQDAWVDAPGITDAIHRGEALYRAVRANPSVAGYAIMRTAERDEDGTVTKIDPDGFWESVRTGANLDRGNPALTLHNWLLLGTVRDRLPADKRLMELYAFTTAWNKHARNENYARVNPNFDVRPRTGLKYFAASSVPDFLPLPGKDGNLLALSKAHQALEQARR